MQNKKYVSQRKLGQGAMGEVWLATDTHHNRSVAIKYLPPVIETTQQVQLLSETQQLTRLNHPNLADIHEIAIDGDTNQLYVVREYIDGESLADVIAKDEPLPLMVILDITMGILHALQYLNTLGIVHQNLTPANVFITNNEIKVVDTGLTGLISNLSPNDNDTPILSNPSYLSPEQAENRGIDSRSDLYSLGVILFEMVTGGTLPFTYDDVPTLLRAHAYAPPPSIRTLIPDVPLVLERTIMRLLSKSPRSRYASADVVISVLGSIHAQQKINQAPLTVPMVKNTPLIGRKAEMEQMEAHWTQVKQSSKSSLLVVQGEMGIGKTRLISEFINSKVIGQNLIAIEGRCEEFGAVYTPFTTILTTIFKSQMVEHKTILGQIAPIVNQLPGTAQFFNADDMPAIYTPANDPKLMQWQFFEAVLTVLTELGPTVLFLEDANLLDETSLALTQFLIKHGQLPLWIVAAYSTNNEPVPWIDKFPGDRQDNLTLPPLSAASTGQFLTNLMGEAVSEALITMIHKQSQGNPSFIEGLIRYLLDSGQCHKDQAGRWHYTPPKRSQDHTLPSTLFNLFTRRVQKLSEQNQQTLALAGVIGHEFKFDTWVTLLGGETKQAKALDALNEALDLRLLREGANGTYTFYPADIANVLALLLSTSQQKELHLQVVDYLLNQTRLDSAAVAYHYKKAGMPHEAAQYLEKAGSEAVAKNAINRAITYYLRANTLRESQNNYEALGNLYRQKGAADEAIRAFNQALKLARLAENYNDEARILNGLSFILWLYDSYEEADEAAAAVLKLPNISEVQRAIAQSHLGMILWLRGQLIDAEYWCQKAVELLENIEGDEASIAGAYSRLGLVYFARSQYGDAKVMFNQSLKIRQKLDDYWGHAYSLNNLGKVATDQGDFEQAISLLLSAQQLFANIDSNDGLMVVYANQARALLREGLIDKALPLLEKALYLANEIGKQSAYGLSDIYLLTAEAKIQDKEPNEAKLLIDRAIHLVEVAGNQEYIARSQMLLGQIYVLNGELDEAESTYHNAIALFKRVGSLSGVLQTQLNYTRLLRQQGQSEEGAMLEQETYNEATRIGLYL